MAENNAWTEEEITGLDAAKQQLLLKLRALSWPDGGVKMIEDASPTKRW